MDAHFVVGQPAKEIGIVMVVGVTVIGVASDPLQGFNSSSVIGVSA